MTELTNSYWDKRYKTKDIGWDIGYPSTPLVEYFNQLENPHLEFLIPGSGHSYEAEYLWELGFDHVHALDYSETAFEGFKKRCPDFPEDQLHVCDFFEHQGQYDLIVEQTFFCALDPSLRRDYATKVKSLLKPGGKVVGVLFDGPMRENEPPYGGNALEYLGYFQPHFEQIYMKPCYNSIPPRAGRELFIILQ